MKLTTKQKLAIQQSMRRHIEGEHYHDHMGDTLSVLLEAFGVTMHPVARCESCREWAYSDIGLCERCEPEGE